MNKLTLSQLSKKNLDKIQAGQGDDKDKEGVICSRICGSFCGCPTSEDNKDLFNVSDNLADLLSYLNSFQN